MRVLDICFSSFFLLGLVMACSQSDQSDCTPDCNEAVCGPDGCGGTCGACPAEQACQAGACVCNGQPGLVCRDGDVWTSDGCGQPAQLQTVCDQGCANGACTECTPDCKDKTCGPNGCGGTCGDCQQGADCTNGTCVCAPQASKACLEGHVWWYDSCGQPGTKHAECEFGCDAGECVPCLKNCDDLVCGPDPVCGQSCGLCLDDADCLQGACVPKGCQADQDCDDGLACTDNTCDDDRVCQTTPLSDCDWPAEQPTDAENLTPIEGPVWDNDFYRDLSGAVWNPVTRTLWVCRNNGPSKVWAIVEDGKGSFQIEDRAGERAEWDSFLDLEGLTQANFAESQTLYLMIESGGKIREFDFSSTEEAEMKNDWNCLAQLGGDGAEGITFVPDAFLIADGFTNPAGQPTKSENGMGGLMFVGHQGGGFIYVFDLDRSDSTYDFVGKYATDRDETAGLEFDRSTGLLYIWHGADHNVLEVARLSSTRQDSLPKLDTVKVYTGPDPVPLVGDNHEGIALFPVEECANNGRSFFLTTDGAKTHSLMHYRDFPCERPSTLNTP